ncbi:hypothetical protein SDC9_207106 [bioreactor metagenome]|uniref:Uncharacterized protein n=1 Tax=bioreactor metagenome TaxID=1076179 RepID=A0A645J6P3_9ZZZZ
MLGKRCHHTPFFSLINGLSRAFFLLERLVVESFEAFPDCIVELVQRIKFLISERRYDMGCKEPYCAFHRRLVSGFKHSGRRYKTTVVFSKLTVRLIDLRLIPVWLFYSGFKIVRTQQARGSMKVAERIDMRILPRILFLIIGCFSVAIT